MLRIVAFPAFRNREGNPYTSLLYDHIGPFVRDVTDYHHFRLMPKHVDIIHLHWPDLAISGKSLPRVIARSLLLLSRLAIAKLRGAKIVWTVHNLTPHDRSNRFVSWVYWKIFFYLVDGAIFLSVPARSAALAALPALRSKPSVVIPHGHYKPVLSDADYIRDKTGVRAKYRLPQDRFIYLHFGQVRDYKNVEALVEEFLALSERDALLLIAGSVGSSDVRKQWLTQIAATHGEIRVDLRHIPEDVLFEYLEACDLVVLPYKRILNSGSAMMALSAGRPVLAPNIGSIPEIADHVGRDWLITYEGPFNRHVLAAARRAATEIRRPVDLGYFDWVPIAHRTAEFYQRLRNAV
jgi:glycosyltransferase involved in cell wall biosynthesis